MQFLVATKGDQDPTNAEYLQIMQAAAVYSEEKMIKLMEVRHLPESGDFARSDWGTRTFETRVQSTRIHTLATPQLFSSV